MTNCGFLQNRANCGGSLFFEIPFFPYNSLDNMGNSFQNNIAKIYGDNFASIPFRLILTNASDTIFNSDNFLKNASLIRIQPGRKFDIPFKFFPIDQFNQNAISKFKNE